MFNEMCSCGHPHKEHEADHSEYGWHLVCSCLDCTDCDCDWCANCKLEELRLEARQLERIQSEEK